MSDDHLIQFILLLANSKRNISNLYNIQRHIIAIKEQLKQQVNGNNNERKTRNGNLSSRKVVIF
jgi:hypothetical protein